MGYRDDVAALSARHDALAAEVAERNRELAASRVALDEASARARRPILDSIRVAAPCKASWDDMVGDDRVRHCAGCDKDVFNLSALTRDEAEALIRERVGNLCGRYYQRADGTIITSDCTVGISQRRRRRVMAAGFAALFASAGGLAMALSRRSADSEPVAIACPQAIDAVPSQVSQVEPPPPVRSTPSHAVPSYPRLVPMLGHVHVSQQPLEKTMGVLEVMP